MEPEALATLASAGGTRSNAIAELMRGAKDMSKDVAEAEAKNMTTEELAALASAHGVRSNTLECNRELNKDIKAVMDKIQDYRPLSGDAELLKLMDKYGRSETDIKLQIKIIRAGRKMRSRAKGDDSAAAPALYEHRVGLGAGETDLKPVLGAYMDDHPTHYWRDFKKDISKMKTLRDMFRRRRP
jgi:hypothetical protein